MDAKLEIEVKKDQNTEGKYTLSMNVLSATDIPETIFVYEKRTDGLDYFYTVANPSHLVDFPKFTPDKNLGHLFFLDKLIDLEFLDAKTMLDAEARIMYEIRELKKNWDLVSGQVEQEYIVEI